MEALRVDWTLSAPLQVGDYPIHLDDLIAYGVVHGSGPLDWSRRDALPLERFRGEGGAVWCASMLWAPSAAPVELMAIRRPVGVAELAEDRDIVWSGRLNKLTAGTGRHKAFDARIATQRAPQVSAWFVGDLDAVTRALRLIRYIGGGRRIGLGRVRNMSIVADARASELWRWRHMPDPVEGYAAVEGTLQPPYWDRLAARKVYAPLDGPQGVTP